MLRIGDFSKLSKVTIKALRYYECPNCNHKYIPTYKSVLFAMHVNRTRKMKCPKCGKKTWQKKVLK